MGVPTTSRRTDSPTRVATVVLAAAVVLGGCGVEDPPIVGSGHGMPAVQGMRGMHATMAPRDEADYLLAMVPHHREAIVAAQSLARSQHPELRRLGRSIRTTQSLQVRLMEHWIARWYPAATPSTDYQPMMSDLSDLRGDALARTFLAEMVHHHMMAVMMSRHLMASGLVRHASVAGLARTVIDDQSAEIVQMRQWLRQWR